MPHSLDKEEQAISAEASKKFGIRVQVFRDITWICQALQGQYKDAYYHSTAEQAVKAFADENGIV